MSCGDYHLFFGLLSNELKIGIIEKLLFAPLSVSVLANEIMEERSKVSHALLALKKCNIVKAEKAGKERIYSVNNKTIKPIFELVDRHVKENCIYCRAKKRS